MMFSFIEIAVYTLEKWINKILSNIKQWKQFYDRIKLWAGLVVHSSTIVLADESKYLGFNFKE